MFFFFQLEVRVSVHKSRGVMACSPNNAILSVNSDFTSLRRFFVLVRDGDRVEVSVNALVIADHDCDQLMLVLQRVAAKANQTDLSMCCQELLSNKATFVIASFLNTFL
jgi:hypothetical protein